MLICMGSMGNRRQDPGEELGPLCGPPREKAAHGAAYWLQPLGVVPFGESNQHEQVKD